MSTEDPSIKHHDGTIEGAAVPTSPPVHGTWHSARACPHYGESQLERIRLPRDLRPFRWIGFNVRSYRCRECLERSLFWRSGI